MQPFPKMFKIESELDIEMDNQYAYVKLLTGQKIRLTREIVRKMYTEIVRRSGTVDIPLQDTYINVIAINNSEPKIFAGEDSINWPRGTKNAPTWVTADGRALLVTEMEDSHIENAIRLFGKKIKELKMHRPPIWDTSSRAEYNVSMQAHIHRIEMVKNERTRRQLYGR